MDSPDPCHESRREEGRKGEEGGGEGGREKRGERRKGREGEGEGEKRSVCSSHVPSSQTYVCIFMFSKASEVEWLSIDKELSPSHLHRPDANWEAVLI